MVDFFGCKVFAIDFAFDGDIEDVFREVVAAVEEMTAADVVAFIREGGVVLNCNQSR